MSRIRAALLTTAIAVMSVSTRTVAVSREGGGVPFRCGQIRSASCLASVSPVRTGLTDPTVGNNDWSQA